MGEQAETKKLSNYTDELGSLGIQLQFLAGGLLAGIISPSEADPVFQLIKDLGFKVDELAVEMHYLLRNEKEQNSATAPA